MGKLILCTGRMAERPLCLPWPFGGTASEIRLWSVEELCLYVERNLENVDPEFFGPVLAEWLRTECGLPETADKLAALRRKGYGVKDLAVALWCATDYYTEPEILGLMKLLRELENLPGWKKRRKCADRLLRAGNFGRARAEYEAVLRMAGPGEEECGNLLHCIALTQLHTSEPGEAATSFYLAYKQNHNPASLAACLTAWWLAGREDEIRRIAREEAAGEEFLAGLTGRWQGCMEEAEQDGRWRKVEELPGLIAHLQEEYRDGVQR